MSGVRGVSDLRAEQLTGLPQLRIAVDRAARRAWALARRRDSRGAHRPGRREESQIWVGQRRFDLVVRLPDEQRNDVNAISLAASSTAMRGRASRSDQLASIEQTFGPGAIRREAGSRRIAVEASAYRTRSWRRRARHPTNACSEDLQLPQGYFFNVGGRVESQARASRPSSRRSRSRCSPFCCCCISRSIRSPKPRDPRHDPGAPSSAASSALLLAGETGMSRRWSG